jgi:Xaa-Pro aminopeptidase
MNLRGSDIEFNPVFFSYALVTTTALYLFIDDTKVTPEIHQHFDNNEIKVDVRPYNQVHTVLKELADAATTKKVWISLNSSYALTALIPESKRHQEITPICTMKAIKNEVEVQGFINSHVRDGVALCQYFAWLEDAVKRGDYVDELTGAVKLEGFRASKDKFMGLSFTTINGFGPNGSVIHYHPKEETNRQITDKELYLCDSGAQYL